MQLAARVRSLIGRARGATRSLGKRHLALASVALFVAQCAPQQCAPAPGSYFGWNFDTATLPIQIFGLTFSQAIRPDLYALGAATTAITLLIILVMLIGVTLLARRRSAPVVRVEEEFGETVGLDRAATVVRES